MYTLKEARVLERTTRAKWVIEDITHHSMESLYRLYKAVYWKMTHPLLSHPIYVNIDDLVNRFNTKIDYRTVKQWLLDLGDRSLPTTDYYPNTLMHTAHYRYAWSVDYDIKPVHRLFNPEVPVSEGHSRDLRITHPKIDAKLLFDQCLISINGFYHRTNFAYEGVHVLDGFRNAQRSNNNAIGLTHLGALSSFKYVPIRPPHIRALNKNGLYKDGVVIEVDPFTEVENKTILIVLGGLLHIPGYQFTRMSERTYLWSIKDYPLIPKFFEMRKGINMNPVTRLLSKSTVNKYQVSVEEMYSNKIIEAILSLPQSFFIVMDTDHLYVDYSRVESADLPGRYKAHIPPKYPLMNSMGRVCEYTSKECESHWVLSTSEYLDPLYLMETTGYLGEVSVDDSKEPHRLYEYTRPYFLKLSVEKKD